MSEASVRSLLVRSVNSASVDSSVRSWAHTVRAGLNGDVRDHLAHNAAHVLAALDEAPVDTVCDKAFLTAHDAATL